MQREGNQQGMRIEHLAERIAVIPILASWVQEEWGHLLPDVTFEALVSEFEERTTNHKIPETFVAVKDTKLVGMASIVKHDMSTRKDLSPWLAAVYVAPESRNRGIGSRLVRTVMQEADTLGLEMLQEVHQEGTLPGRWLACDEAFGRSTDFMDGVGDLGLWYYAEVPYDTQVWRTRPLTYVPEWSGKGRRPTRERLVEGEP